MKLKFVNQQALFHDIQMPTIQTEPLEFGKVYEVGDDIAHFVLHTGHWERVEEEIVAGKDDLTRISGIGKRTANVLIEKGIDAFHFLVGKTPEEIDAMLDGALNYVTVDTIAGWQAHARQLMEE